MTSAFSFDAFKPLAGRALQDLLNRVIRLDPATLQALHGLEGRRIELHMQAPDLAMAIDVRAQTLCVGPVDVQQEADIRFSSKLSNLMNALPRFAQGKSAVGAMRINGDVELARMLQDLAKAFDPDWTLAFSQVLGPVFGPQAAKALREGLRHAKISAENVLQSTSEYLTEEARVVVGDHELNAFYDQVDSLRQHADRLLARAAHLHGKQD